LQSLDAFRIYLYSIEEWKLFLAIMLGFSIVYFSLAGLFSLLTIVVFPRIGLGRRIENHPQKKGQIANEIKRSFYSIAVFALYGVITLACEQLGWLHIIWQFTWQSLIVDLVVLFLWNEIHFYICHRLLHQRWLYRHVHVHHHRSVIPSPFSTYSFHWFEAILLSSVMISCMTFYTLSFPAMMVFPLLSLVLNNIGHMNYEIFKWKGINTFASCQRHTLHHLKGHVNFGFFLPWLDKIFQTHYPSK
jgi:Delta7-sterol 5-desaturase